MARKPKTGMLTDKTTKSSPADGRYTSPGSALPPRGTAGIKGTAPTKSAPSNEMITSPGGPMTSSPETGGIKPMQDVKSDTPETGGVKPMRDVKGDSTPSEMTFTFFEGAERGNASPTSLYGSREAEQLTEAELRAYFEGDTVNRLPEVFGTFDNYLAYMTEREGLIQSGDYDVGNWDEYTGSLTEDELMILGGDDLTQYGDDASSTYEELFAERTQNQSAAYENWVNSEANQALLAKYGVNDTVYSETGDKFRWNGSAYVKTVNEDHAGLTDYVKMAMVTALTVGSGAAVAAVAPALGTVGSATLGNAITQAITTGSIDPDQLLQTAATAGFGQALNQVIGPALSEALGGLDLSKVTGIEQVDNVLTTMGQTAIRQAAFDGSLDMDQIVTSGLFATAKEFAQWLAPASDSEENKAKLAEWNKNTSEAQQAALTEALSDTFGESVIDDINEQMSVSMSTAMQRIADNLNARYAPEPEPEFISPEESTVDAAGSEFADTTMSEDEFLETETFQDFEPERQPITYPEDQVRVVNGVVYSRNPDGSLGEVLSIEEGADPQKVLDQLVTPVTRYGETVSGVSGYDLDSEAVSFLYDELGEEGLNKLLQENGMTLHQSSPGNFIIIDNQTGGIAPSVNLDDLTELGTREIADIVSPEEQQNNDYVRQTILADAVEAATPEEAPETPLDSSMEFEAEEYEFEPEVEPEPVEPVEPVEPDPVDPTDTTDTTDPGDAGVGTPAVDTVVGGMLTGQETPTDPAQAPAQPSAQAPAQAPAQPSAQAPAQPSAQAPSGDTVGTTPTDPGTGLGQGAGVPAGSDTTTDTTTPSYEQGSMIGDAEGLIELALQSGATTEYLLENYPQYTDLINEISGRTDTQETDAPIVEELFDDVLGDAREDAAVADYTTAEEVANIVNQIVANTPNAETLTPEQVNGLVEQAISEIPQADSLTPEQVEAVVESATSNLQQGVSQQITGVEAGLQEALSAQAQGQAEALSDAEANLLSQITGVEAGVLQQISSVEGALNESLAGVGIDIAEVQGTVSNIISSQQQAGEAQAAFESSVAGQFEQVGGELTGIQSDISGLGQQVGGIGAGLEGIGEGIAGIGEGLGAGLLGLALQQQQLPEQIAAAMPRQPVKFDPFLKGLSPRKMPTPLKVQGMLV